MKKLDKEIESLIENNILHQRVADLVKKYAILMKTSAAVAMDALDMRETAHVSAHAIVRITIEENKFTFCNVVARRAPPGRIMGLCFAQGKGRCSLLRIRQEVNKFIDEYRINKSEVN